jgi:hypothetical protein
VGQSQFADEALEVAGERSFAGSHPYIQQSVVSRSSKLLSKIRIPPPIGHDQLPPSCLRHIVLPASFRTYLLDSTPTNSTAIWTAFVRLLIAQLLIVGTRSFAGRSFAGSHPYIQQSVVLRLSKLLSKIRIPPPTGHDQLPPSCLRHIVLPASFRAHLLDSTPTNSTAIWTAFRFPSLHSIIRRFAFI